MTRKSSNLSEPSGQYVWQADQLLAATKAVSGHWHHSHHLHHGHRDTTEQAALPTLCSTRICTDTRTLQAGDIFLALVGDRFDGHDYLETAQQKGAAAVIVSRVQDSPLPQLLVTDTRRALGCLGAYCREQQKQVRIIALTGSSGKTTCKEMLGSILSRLAPTLITRGNLNNDLGVPMMLLELSEQHQYAVLELGANHVGEIAYSAALVEPEVACVLNVGTAHLGEFGSRERICTAKAEIYQALSARGTAVVPEQDEFADSLRQQAAQYTQNILGFGAGTVLASQITVGAEGTEFRLHLAQSSAMVKLPLAGEHNINNALAAAACAFALGVDLEDIVAGLQMTRPAKGRLHSRLYGSHRLIDDTYNANPHSVRAAAKVLAAQSGERIMVLGDIAELGAAAASEHQALGRAIAATGIEQLWCVGSHAHDVLAGTNEVGGVLVHAFDDKASLQAHMQQHLRQQSPCTLLVKGSRTMRMESLIDALVEE